MGFGSSSSRNRETNTTPGSTPTMANAKPGAFTETKIYDLTPLPLPKNDIIYKNIYYFEAIGRKCQFCKLFHNPRHGPETPRMYNPRCKSWFHESCLLTWFLQDQVPPNSCHHCHRLHHRTRWSGPIRFSQQQHYPGADVPDIRSCLTHKDLKARLSRVKRRDTGPWFSDIMPMCEKPERMVDRYSEEAEKQYARQMKEIKTHRDKLNARFDAILEHRRSLKVAGTSRTGLA
jgi:hypothetical protein